MKIIGKVIDISSKRKGAISIFLVIVLVPMLVVSSVFVDISRVKLAEAVAKSSGDLTLNTALTNYDAVLKDMYGLFAISQDTDELFENLENYYRGCIEAAGVAEPDAENYVDYIMQFVKTQGGNDDLLNMNLTGFDVTTKEGGNLANPAILKTQIVEFMKYRAPINLGTGIFDALSSMKNLKKQNELINNKNKFYEQQTNMMEKLEAVWNDIERYQYSNAKWSGDPLYNSGFPTGDYLKDASNLLDKHSKRLENNLSLFVRYVYYADSDYCKPAFNGEVYNVNASVSSDKKTTAWVVTQTDKYTYKASSDNKPASVKTLEENLQTAFYAVNVLKDVKSGEIYKLLAQGNNLSDTQKIKIVRVTNNTLTTGYHKAIKDYVSSIVNLKNSYNSISKDELKNIYVKIDGLELSFYKDDGTENAIPKGAEPIVNFIETQTKNRLTVDDNGKITDTEIIQYNEIIKRANGYFNDTEQVVKKVKNHINGYETEYFADAKSIYNKIVLSMGTLDSAIKKLNAIKGELNNQDSEYNKALARWKNSANGLSADSMGQENLSEIEKLKDFLTIVKVEKLINRLTDAKKTLEEEKIQVEAYKVLGEQWINLTDKNPNDVQKIRNLLNDNQKKAIENVKPSTTQTEIIELSGKDYVTAHYNEEYNKVISDLVATIKKGSIIFEWEDTSKAPDLTKNQAQLYTWLYNNFCEKNKLKEKYGTTQAAGSNPQTSQNVTDNKDNAGDAQKAMEEEAKKYNSEPTKQTETPPNRGYDSKYLPSGEWKGIKLSVLSSEADPSDTTNTKAGSSDDMLSASANSLGMFDDLLKLAKDMTTNLRDDLYVTNYIMNMFSYSTFEAEIAVDNKNDVRAFDSWYEYDSASQMYKLKSNFSGTYKNSVNMLKDAETLTKVQINPNNNWLYGKEVEYIIYGDNGTAKTYGTIYAIRFAFNIVHAFTDSEIGNLTTAAATALFGTPPLTPLIPVAKIAITIGLALAESAYDLYQLKCGEKVPFMKNNSTWVMKPSSALKTIGKEIASDIATKIVDEAIDEGVKILNDALNMTNEELDKLINSGEEELNNLIYAATENTINELGNYGNQAIQELVNICNAINTEEMENANYKQGQSSEKINKAIAKLDEWLSKQGNSDSDVIYLAKKTAVKVIKQNGGEKIGEIFDSIGVTNLNINAKEKLSYTINDILENIQREVLAGIKALNEDDPENNLHKLTNATTEKLKKAASEGAESFRSMLKEEISSRFGDSSSLSEVGVNSVTTSLLSWSYSDYLQLFLLVGMVASPESILLRTADVIELNMQKGNLGYIETTEVVTKSRLFGLIKSKKEVTSKKVNANAYKLSKSYTYIGISANIEVKPLLLAIPLISGTVKGQIGGNNWYQINYSGTLGY